MQHVHSNLRTAHPTRTLTRNTRDAIWDAMAARETFVTSGTRIKVRFFGGADLGAASTNPRELVEQGYRNGVPMGGTIDKASKAPTFTVWAAKDPNGANLDRIQIIIPALSYLCYYKFFVILIKKRVGSETY